MELYDYLGSMVYNFAALIIASTCLFYTVAMRRKVRFRNLLFIFIVIIIIIDALTTMSEGFIYNSGLSDHEKLILYHVEAWVYYFTHFILAPIFAYYVIVACNVGFRFSLRLKVSLAVPFYLSEILLLLNPFTHGVFYYDTDFVLHRGPALYFAYAVSGFYALYALTALFIYWGTIERIKRSAIFFCFLIIITGTILQMVFPEFKVELICEALGFLGVMILIENDDGRLDMTTGVFNRNAFTLFFYNY